MEPVEPWRADELSLSVSKGFWANTGQQPASEIGQEMPLKPCRIRDTPETEEDVTRSFLGQLVPALSSWGIGAGHARYTGVEMGTPHSAGWTQVMAPSTARKACMPFVLTYFYSVLCVGSFVPIVSIHVCMT